MMSKSGTGFSEKIMLKQKARTGCRFGEKIIPLQRGACAVEHDPEKWAPVFRKVMLHQDGA
jgi:hypothetical protein